MLGLYGEADTGIPPDQVKQMEAALKAAGKTAEFHEYPGAPHGFVADYRASFLLVLIYAGISSLTGFALYGCWRYASYHRRLLVRSVEDRTVRWISDLLLLTPLIFLASIPIALVDPSIAEYSWLAVFVLPIVYVRSRTGQVQRLEGRLDA